MTSNLVETTGDLPQVEAPIPAPSQGEGMSSSPPPSDMPPPEASKTISFVESPPVPPVVPSIPLPAPQLLFPLPAPFAGKSGITLSELVADLGNTSTVTPDIATAAMVVAGESSDESPMIILH